MPTGSVDSTLVIDGIEFKQKRTPAASGKYTRAPAAPLAAAKVGQLTTRTDNTTGTLTMANGHGITTGARLDVYWAAADGTRGCRYGVTVGTVATNAVPLTNTGGGDALPPLNTNVTAAVPTLYDFAVEFAGLQALGFRCEKPAVAVFRNTGGNTVFAAVVDDKNDSFAWDASSGIANPAAADMASVYMSHGASDAAYAPAAAALMN